MIIVSVQLLSAIDGRHEEIARMEICNMGTGTVHKGNYSAETLRGRSTQDFARRTRQRIGYINGYPRLREHVWNLVAKCLRTLRYGGDWNTGMPPAAEPVGLREALEDVQRFHKSYICLGGDNDDGEEYVRWSDVVAALATPARTDDGEA